MGEKKAKVEPVYVEFRYIGADASAENRHRNRVRLLEQGWVELEAGYKFGATQEIVDKLERARKEAVIKRRSRFLPPLDAVLEEPHLPQHQVDA